MRQHRKGYGQCAQSMNRGQQASIVAARGDNDGHQFEIHPESRGCGWAGVETRCYEAAPFPLPDDRCGGSDSGAMHLVGLRYRFSDPSLN